MVNGIRTVLETIMTVKQKKIHKALEKIGITTYNGMVVKAVYIPKSNPDFKKLMQSVKA
jgi:hypothetical protein